MTCLSCHTNCPDRSIDARAQLEAERRTSLWLACSSRPRTRRTSCLLVDQTHLCVVWTHQFYNRLINRIECWNEATKLPVQFGHDCVLCLICACSSREVYYVCHEAWKKREVKLSNKLNMCSRFSRLNYFSFGSLSRKLLVTAVLPVPVGPTNSTGTKWCRNVFKKKDCLAVSSVWIKRSVT